VASSPPWRTLPENVMFFHHAYTVGSSLIVRSISPQPGGRNLKGRMRAERVKSLVERAVVSPLKVPVSFLATVQTFHKLLFWCSCAG